MVFKENTICSFQNIINFQTILNYNYEFPECNLADINKVIVVQENKIFKKEFIAPFLYSFFNANRSKELNLFIIYSSLDKIQNFLNDINNYFN